MKKVTLLVSLSVVLLLVAGCQIQTSEKETVLPSEVKELQSQTVPEIQKQSVSKKTVESSVKNDVVLYKGSWFDIKYPKGFTARPTVSMTDEAYFLSPDGSVEFFVFSPLWAGDPSEYLNIPSTEELVSEKTDESGLDLNNKIVRWVTVKAKDGSYYRSFVSIKNQVGTGSDLHHVFGIKYQNNIAYEKYKDAYATFKNSLQQYAD